MINSKHAMLFLTFAAFYAGLINASENNNVSFNRDKWSLIKATHENDIKRLQNEEISLDKNIESMVTIKNGFFADGWQDFMIQRTNPTESVLKKLVADETSDVPTLQNTARNSSALKRILEDNLLVNAITVAKEQLKFEHTLTVTEGLRSITPERIEHLTGPGPHSDDDRKMLLMLCQKNKRALKAYIELMQEQGAIQQRIIAKTKYILAIGTDVIWNGLPEKETAK
jgi:hypothetical protein